MSATAGLVVCLLVAAAISGWCLRRAVIEYRAEVSAPEPVDRALWELDDDAAVARWLEATS